MQDHARINVITLGVHDLPSLRAFYEALGWRSHSVGDDWARFDTGGATLALFPLQRLAAEAHLRVPDQETGFKGTTLACCVARPEDVDRSIETARKAGARILTEPVEREWGGRSGYFADPEDNVWEVAWVRGAAFTAEGIMSWPPIG